MKTDGSPLTESQLRALLVERVYQSCSTYNSGYLRHTGGLIRGLAWALTGEDPGPYCDTDVPGVLERCGIPVVRHEDEQFSVPDEWCLANGLTSDEQPLFAKKEPWRPH